MVARGHDRVMATPSRADVRAILGELTGLPDGELVELGRGADSAAYLLEHLRSHS